METFDEQLTSLFLIFHYLELALWLEEKFPSQASFEGMQNIEIIVILIQFFILQNAHNTGFDV